MTKRFNDKVNYNVRHFVNDHTSNKYYVNKTLDILNFKNMNVYIFEAVDIHVIPKNSIPRIILEVVEATDENKISIHILDDESKTETEWWTE